MASQGEAIRKSRIEKLDTMRSHGVDPYPAYSAFQLTSIEEVVKNFKKLSRAKKKTIALGGRVMARREHGGSVFVDLESGGKFQIFFGKDKIGEEKFDSFQDLADIGDIVAVSGTLFVTKRKEPTLEARDWQMLAKSLLPLPEKWHGLQDVEERFRKRYLDTLMNPAVRDRFLKRSAVIRELRSFFDKSEFVEVETPMLQPIPGGALARPFKTRHNALDVDLYLRIAPELYLKELMVGGFGKVYEVGKSFRNEGMSHTHNPEFTTVEWYAAYWGEEEMMKFTEKFFKHLIKKITGSSTISYQGKEISFVDSFGSISFKEILRRYAHIMDYDAVSRDDLVLAARRFGIDPEGSESKGKIADEIYKKVCRPHIQKPTFLTHHPLEISPLAKKQDDKKTVRRFQLIAGGMELTNGFSELNDPLDQKERFLEQKKMKEAGEEETHPIDTDYIEAMEYGMPPCAGNAIGIDRLVMLLTDTDNIKEVILFPTMRPK